ncbi:MAG: hypothetical protein ABI969_03190, partial [bacterium]
MLTSLLRLPFNQAVGKRIPPESGGNPLPEIFWVTRGRFGRGPLPQLRPRVHFDVLFHVACYHLPEGSMTPVVPVTTNVA